MRSGKGKGLRLAGRIAQGKRDRRLVSIARDRLSGSQVRIGVMGSAAGTVDSGTAQLCRQLGSAIARHGCCLLTGACPGLPHAAVVGAKESAGHVVGISPASSLKEHVEVYASPFREYDVLIFTGLGFMGRELINIRSSDIVVVAGRRSGTLGEFAIAYEEGKLIGVLVGTGGISEALPEMENHLARIPAQRSFTNPTPTSWCGDCWIGTFRTIMFALATPRGGERRNKIGKALMDTAVALVETYLRINGFFTVTEYPVVARERGETATLTDVDVLAVRFPGAERWVSEKGGSGAALLTDPELGNADHRLQMIIGEVKEGSARLNKRAYSLPVVEAVIRRFGCCSPNPAAAARAKVARGKEIATAVAR